MILDINAVFVEFFKSIAGMLGYGLPGLAALFVIVIAFLIWKAPQKKGLMIGIFMAFCCFILVFFATAGIGLVQKNKEIESKNDTLNTQKKELAKSNDSLKTTVAITDLTLKASQIINDAATGSQSSDTLATKISDIAAHIDTLKSKNILIDTKSIDTLAKSYKTLAHTIKVNNMPIKDRNGLLIRNYGALQKSLVRVNMVKKM
jgi:hypothetical protein